MSTYVIGLLLRTPIPGADAAHKLILSVLEEHIGRGDHPDIDRLAAIAQLSRATLYRKLTDLAAADLLHRREKWAGREKSYWWEVNEDLLRALHGDHSEGVKERAQEAVWAGFKRASQSENSQSEKKSQPAKRQRRPGHSQSETACHNSQSENSQSENPSAAPQHSHPENPPPKNPPVVVESESEGLEQAKEVVERCYAVAGPGLADHNKHGTLLMSQSTIHQWLRNGHDPDLDIYPTIQAMTRRPPKGGPVRYWTYFTEAIANAKREREAPPPEPFSHNIPTEGSSYGQPRSASIDALIDAGVEEFEARGAKRRSQ